MRLWSLLMASALTASPALAQEQLVPADDPLAPLDTQPVPDQPAPPPTQPTATVATPVIVAPPRSIPKDWPGVFAAIRAGDWSGAQFGINALPDGPLKPVATAELYTARGSPRIELSQITALLAVAPDLPQAEQLQRLAITRGAIDPPPIVTPQQLVFLGSAPRRQRASGVTGEPLADTLRAQLDPLVKIDDALGAEALLTEQAPYLTPDARAEAGQRVAWIYYVLGQDAEARRVADQWRVAAGGEWGGQAAWISGLAAWRSNDCTAASAAFRDAARLTADRELGAAAYYWAARSEQACRRPEAVEPLLRAAARSADSFYGLVARETLGLSTRLDKPDRPGGGWREPVNVARARELVAIGERGLADELIRYQARLSPAADQPRLMAVAEQLNLPATQYWLAHNGPPGTRVQPADRFPALRWRPANGWRIDPALAAAHTRQESDFRTAVVSPANAIGLMQVRPIMATDVARERGIAIGDLKDPVTNLEYGQTAIEIMRRGQATQGQLVRVIAAYNAGLVPVARWASIPDRGDPLLWMESLSYWETRYYVPSVLRNMFVYQGLDGRDQPALKAIAEHKWPAFPTAESARAR